MNRQQLEHILRAAAAITGAHELVVIGSQSILGKHPQSPHELLMSVEADVYAPGHPDQSELIDGTIGEASPFHQTFGYYAHGVGEETATLPAGWSDRLIPVSGPNTGGATGLCLEPHDLATSKLVAGREKDLAFIAAMIAHHLANPGVLQQRLDATALTDALRDACEARLKQLLANGA